MRKYSAENAVNKARQICKYDPEFNYDEETGMIQIWDYSEDFEQSFHRLDYCKANQINLDELFDLIKENHFSYVTALFNAYDYEVTETSCFLDGKEYEINKNIILNYLENAGSIWTDKEKLKIADEVCFRMDSLELCSEFLPDVNFVEEVYADAACKYLFAHDNNVDALISEEDDLAIFDYIGTDALSYEEERD